MNDITRPYRHDSGTGVRIKLDTRGRVTQITKHVVSAQPVEMSGALPASIAITVDGVAYPIAPDLIVGAGPTPGA